MTEFQREMMNFAYWHVWGDWWGAIFLGLGVACGIGLVGLFLKENWKWFVPKMAIGFLASSLLYFLYDYIHFVVIWKDIIINGNY